VLDPLAKKVIAGDIREGSTVRLDAPKKGGSGLVFSANSR
jgi:hypothetical protein